MAFTSLFSYLVFFFPFLPGRVRRILKPSNLLWQCRCSLPPVGIIPGGASGTVRLHRLPLRLWAEPPLNAAALHRRVSAACTWSGAWKQIRPREGANPVTTSENLSLQHFNLDAPPSPHTRAHTHLTKLEFQTFCCLLDLIVFSAGSMRVTQVTAASRLGVPQIHGRARVAMKQMWAGLTSTLSRCILFRNPAMWPLTLITGCFWCWFV